MCLDPRYVAGSANPVKCPPEFASSSGEASCAPVAPSALARDSVVALAVVLSIWGLNLVAVAYFARRNRWMREWKMLLVASVFAGPLAVMLWRARKSCGGSRHRNTASKKLATAALL